MGQGEAAVEDVAFNSIKQYGYTTNAAAPSSMAHDSCDMRQETQHHQPSITNILQCHIRSDSNQ
jgi:hypothetical protein